MVMLQVRAKVNSNAKTQKSRSCLIQLVLQLNWMGILMMQRQTQLSPEEVQDCCLPKRKPLQNQRYQDLDLDLISLKI